MVIPAGQFELDAIRQELNKTSKEVGKLKAVRPRCFDFLFGSSPGSSVFLCDGGRVYLQKNQDATELIQSTEEIKARLAAKETEVDKAKTDLDAKLATIGNIVHESVPVSNDEVRSKCQP